MGLRELDARTAISGRRHLQVLRACAWALLQSRMLQSRMLRNMRWQGVQLSRRRRNHGLLAGEQASHHSLSSACKSCILEAAVSCGWGALVMVPANA
jgi:hypothetical protein